MPNRFTCAYNRNFVAKQVKCKIVWLFILLMLFSLWIYAYIHIYIYIYISIYIYIYIYIYICIYMVSDVATPLDSRFEEKLYFLNRHKRVCQFAMWERCYMWGRAKRLSVQLFNRLYGIPLWIKYLTSLP